MLIFDGLFFGKKFKIGTSSFYTILIHVLRLCYQHLVLVSLIIWKLCVFRHRRNFGNFRQFFFIIVFDWKGNIKLWWFYRKDLVQIYQNKTYFDWKKIYIFFTHKSNFLVKKWIFQRNIFHFLFRITFKIQQFCKFWWLHQKTHIKICQTIHK